MNCKYCGSEFIKSDKEYRRLMKNEQTNFYCSHKCFSVDKKTCTECERNCLWCEKLFISSTHKKHKKCCSTECARKYSQSKVDTSKISATIKGMYDTGRLTPPNKRKNPHEIVCKCCANIFYHKLKSKLACSKKCAAILQKLGSSIGGKISASSQNRRSRNEKYFYELCLEKYSDAIHNVPMFNGWDADVIIPSLKIAVMWNGVWHRKKITQAHSLLQVKNRDAIKLREIEKNGYSAYIIEDDGAYNPEFVKKEFDRFYGSVAQLVSAALS